MAAATEKPSGMLKAPEAPGRCYRPGFGLEPEPDAHSGAGFIRVMSPNVIGPAYDHRHGAAIDGNARGPHQGRGLNQLRRGSVWWSRLCVADAARRVLTSNIVC